MDRIVNAVSVIAWALSGVVFVIAARASAGGADAPITAAGGETSAPLETILPQGEIGLITLAANTTINDVVMNDNAAENTVTDDGWHKSSKPENLEPKKSSSQKSSAQKSSSQKSSPKKSAAAAIDQPCVDINTADEAMLTTLKGIGPALASNITQHRAEHGTFTNKDDLLKVKGIGPAKLAGMKDGLCDNEDATAK